MIVKQDIMLLCYHITHKVEDNLINHSAKGLDFNSFLVKNFRDTNVSVALLQMFQTFIVSATVIQ